MRSKSIKIISFLMVIVILFTACGSSNKLKGSVDLLDHYNNGDSLVGMTIDVEVQDFGGNTSAINSTGIFAVEWVGMTNQISYIANNPNSIGSKKKVTLKITEVRATNQIGSATQLQVKGDVV